MDQPNEPESSNDQPPFVGPELPVYPQVDQVVRVTAPAGGVYSCLVQQFVPPLGLRDRESAFAFEANGISLLPGYYLGRLVGAFGGLPLYAIACCPTGSSSSLAGH